MSSANPFFSVIIPTYNREHILPRSVDSVFKQTFNDFELIIVDNGSTDKTELCLKQHYQDDRLIYHYQDGSGSPASPRNKGISLAKGEWICFLDSDDEWLESKLGDVYQAIQNEYLDVICHNENILFEGDSGYKGIAKCGPASKHMYKDMLIFGNRLSTSSTSVRTNFLRDNDLIFNESDDIAIVEDYDLWLNLAKLEAKFKFLSKPLAICIFSDSNLSADSELYCRNFQNLLKLHIFTIQKFSKDKEKLWQLVKIRCDFCEVRYAEIGILFKITGAIKIAIQHPISLLTLLIGRVKREVLVRY